MADLLLESLLDQDIDWLVQAGQQQTLDKDAVPIQQGTPVDSLFIVLSGHLVSAVADDKDSILGKAFSAMAGDSDLKHELFPLKDGDIFGESAILQNAKSPMAVKAEVPSTVLKVPRAKLAAKLAEDLGFASRFYRVMATLLLDRYELLLDKYIHRRGLQLSPIQDGPVIFGELFDSDVDWMISHGSLVQLGPRQPLIQSGRRADTFYIVLQGLLSTSIADGRSTALTQIFTQISSMQSDDQSVGREIARSGRGEVAGETTLIDSRLSRFAVNTMEPATLLAISRRDLSIKLQQDAGMATRFYRVLAILLAERLTSLINRLGYSRVSYRAGQSLDANVSYEDEIDIDLIDHLAIGGARFDWMLKRLKVENR